MTQPIHIFDPVAYYAGLPKKRVAAAMMLQRVTGAGTVEILVVRLSYKDEWVLPGGACDAGEAPAAAAIRETFEEVGVWVDHPQLRLVKFKAVNAIKGDLVEFHYVAQVPFDTVVKIDGHEVVEFRWVPLDQAMPMMKSGWADTLAHLQQAITTNQVLYTEDEKIAA